MLLSRYMIFLRLMCIIIMLLPLLMYHWAAHAHDSIVLPIVLLPMLHVFIAQPIYSISCCCPRLHYIYVPRSYNVIAQIIDAAHRYTEIIISLL